MYDKKAAPQGSATAYRESVQTLVAVDLLAVKESVQLADPYLHTHAALAQLAAWALLCRRQS